MKTSHEQTSLLGADASTSSQADSLVNLSAVPDSDAERKTTATSGRRCCAQYAKSDRLGSLVRTLLESSRWFSPAVKLRWEAVPLYSTKVSYIERSKSSSSKPYAETLSVKDIPSNRLLFRLVPSVRRTGETEFGLLPTVQTAGMALHPKGSGQRYLRGSALEQAVQSGPLPTPTASDATTGAIIGKNDTFITTKNGTPRKVNRNGTNGSVGLARMAKLLPTPRSADACRGGVPLTDGKNVRKSGMVFSAMLSDMAKNGLLPTPKAQEANGNASRDRGKFNLTDEIAKRFKPSGETSQLNPLFVEEMMGFPLDWLVSPFRHGGAKQ